MTLCDTAGQDALDALRQLSYPGCDVFVLCFSVVRPETFRALQHKWLPQFQRLQETQRRTSRRRDGRPAGPPILLVGTQTDLRTDAAVLNALHRGAAEAPVTVADALIVAQSLGAQYVETSSRYRLGVKDAFDAAIWQALMRRGDRGAKRRRPLWRRLLCLA